ncbi:MAG: peptidoglycan-binding protein, partial [Patescibacteria group bacterium]
MSKLLKSKILLGVFVFALAVSFSAVALGADGTITKTLKYGMKDVQVKYLQQTLNETGFTVAAAGRAGSAGFETSFFGNATKAAVKAYQAAMALAADGIFGPMSRASLGGAVVVPPVGTTYPAGCTSAVGFSSTTGVKCDSTVVVTPPVVTG